MMWVELVAGDVLLDPDTKAPTWLVLGPAGRRMFHFESGLVVTWPYSEFPREHDYEDLNVSDWDFILTPVRS